MTAQSQLWLPRKDFTVDRDMHRANARAIEDWAANPRDFITVIENPTPPGQTDATGGNFVFYNGMSYLYTGKYWFPVRGIVGALVAKATDQTVTAQAPSTETITFAASGVKWDTGLKFGDGTNPTFFDDANDRFNIPNGYRGMVRVKLFIRHAPSTGEHQYFITKNGTLIASAVHTRGGVLQHTLWTELLDEVTADGVWYSAVGGVGVAEGGVTVQGFNNTTHTYIELELLGVKGA